MQLDPNQLDKLASESIAARRNAYAPYSQFQVGAAILGADQKVYVGCNVENASYGLTICAERNAVFAMVAAGCREILAVAIAVPGGGTPCGACRQVLVEFGRGFPVLIVDSTTGQVKTKWNIEDLLPEAFRPESLSG